MTNEAFGIINRTEMPVCVWPLTSGAGEHGRRRRAVTVVGDPVLVHGRRRNIFVNNRLVRGYCRTKTTPNKIHFVKLGQALNPAATTRRRCLCMGSRLRIFFLLFGISLALNNIAWTEKISVLLTLLIIPVSHTFLP